jgi:hypothetical protein
VNQEQLKKSYGDDYPAAIVAEGARIPLTRETGFSRTYHSKELNMTHDVSKFMDGSASITLGELERDWGTWMDDERLDFLNACDWLDQQEDFPDMLRFIFRVGETEDWSAIALCIAGHLPKDDAFNLLVTGLRTAQIGQSSNFAQGIARTKHPEAASTLRQHLQRIWQQESIWDDDPFLNWIAFDATTCITHLIEIGAPQSEFEDKVLQLSRHANSGNRDCCRNFLGKYYDSLK